MKKEIKDVYTGFVVTITFGPFPGTGSNLAALPASILASLSAVGIKTKAVSYRIANIPGTDLYVAAVQFLVCPADLQRVQNLIGNPGVLSGPLSSYPALAQVANNIPGTTPVVFALQEAVILNTRCLSSYALRQRILTYITGSGFTVNNFSLLGDNIILTALPRDISPFNDAKLIIGSLLPVLGVDCSKFSDLVKSDFEEEKEDCRPCQKKHKKKRHHKKYE
ncbi:Hypothetical protein BRZCDTV_181 [Brazilian cedratvirus IHUMI]|uniref:Uncharacterized protein n=1 Tax=Brazilian cedratvirus IHUMI TaxID=2126980 RepID=A0A2R8FDR5_9VIRU|nr:Hypothetical protein BRZCDTV_181 [Brazilian cedratvirus IHUMI]